MQIECSWKFVNLFDSWLICSFILILAYFIFLHTPYVNMSTHFKAVLPFIAFHSYFCTFCESVSNHHTNAVATPLWLTCAHFHPLNSANMTFARADCCDSGIFESEIKNSRYVCMWALPSSLLKSFVDWVHCVFFVFLWGGCIRSLKLVSLEV